MAVTTTRSNEKNVYFDLVLELPLKHLKNDKELDRAVAMIDHLLDKPKLLGGEKDYLDVLSDLVREYEDKSIPERKVSDGAMIKHLMEAAGTTQSRTAAATGIAVSTISEVIAGKRRLTREQIGIMAKHFHVEPGVFDFVCEE